MACTSTSSPPMRAAASTAALSAGNDGSEKSVPMTTRLVVGLVRATSTGVVACRTSPAVPTAPSAGEPTTRSVGCHRWTTPNVTSAVVPCSTNSSYPSRTPSVSRRCRSVASARTGSWDASTASCARRCGNSGRTASIVGIAWTTPSAAVVCCAHRFASTTATSPAGDRSVTARILARASIIYLFSRSKLVDRYWELGLARRVSRDPVTPLTSSSLERRRARLRAPAHARAARRRGYARS